MKSVLLYFLILSCLTLLAVNCQSYDDNLRSLMNEFHDELTSDDDLRSNICKIRPPNRLVIRSATGFNAPVLGSLPPGASVERLYVAGTNSGHLWHAVNFAGRKGFVQAKYIACPGDPRRPKRFVLGQRNNEIIFPGCDKSVEKKDEIEELVFGNYEGCEKSARDPNNVFNGKIGYTCNGVSSRDAIANRGDKYGFKYAASKCPANEMFVKCAYDLSEHKFSDARGIVLSLKYTTPGGCSSLRYPAYFVCYDIAVKSGPEVAKTFVEELGPMTSDVKAYARALNQKHRAYCKRIGASNQKFINECLRRANERDAFVNKCDISKVKLNIQDFLRKPWFSYA